MNPTHSTSFLGGKIKLDRLAWLAPLAILACILANIVVRQLGVSLWGFQNDIEMFQPITVIASTVIFLVLALAAFMGVVHFSSHPIRTYRWLAAVALLVSLVNPIMAVTGALPVGASVTLPTFITLIVMHILTALIFVSLITTLVPQSY